MSEHDLHPDVRANFAVLTISDTRTKKTDESGKIAKELISKDGHQVLAYKIIRNDKSLIQTNVKEILQNPEINAIVTIGGTGISKRDATVESVSELLHKKIEGFGELFRNLSYQEIGEAAVISRATAGTINGKLVFCLPGSKNAVKLALNKLILPGLGHIIKEANR
jgi:molybdenum cofactor biosynthesis protein B